MKKIILSLVIFFTIFFSSVNNIFAYTYNQVNNFMGKYYSKLDYNFFYIKDRINKLETLNRKIDNILLFRGDSLSMKNKQLLSYVQYSISVQIREYEKELDDVDLNTIFGNVDESNINNNHIITNGNRCLANGIYIDDGGRTSFYKSFDFTNGKKKYFINYKCRNGKLYELSREFKKLECNDGFDKIHGKCVKNQKRIYIEFDGVKTITWNKIYKAKKYEVVLNNFSKEINTNKYIIPNYIIQGGSGELNKIIIYAYDKNGNSIGKGEKKIGLSNKNCVYEDSDSKFRMFHNDIQSKYVEEDIFGGKKRYKKEFQCYYGKIIILSKRNVTITCNSGFIDNGGYCKKVILNTNNNNNYTNNSSNSINNSNSNSSNNSNSNNNSSINNGSSCSAGVYMGYSYPKINSGSSVDSSKPISNGKAYVKINCNNGYVTRTIKRLDCNSGYKRSGNYCVKGN